MPNWCYNMVEFDAKPAELVKIQALFLDLAHKQMQTGHAHSPDFIAEPDGYFFDIRWEDEILYYETKWAPNVVDIQKIAEYYGVGYIYTYDERSMYVYGEARYIEGIFSEVALEQEDFEKIEPSETYDWYLFEGEQWHSEEEILELLLERKKAQTNC
jgi:hypothetical protein